MKIVIDDQYHSDENKKYTVDENGNIDLFINIGDGEVGNGDTLNDSNNIKINDGENIIESDFTEFEEKIKDEEENEENTNTISGVIVNDIGEETLNSTINSENPWEDERYSKDYNKIYQEIEDNLEKKYSNKDEIVEKHPINSNDIYKRNEEKTVKEATGNINIFSKLGSKDGVEIKGARINLYLLNGVSPKLYDSKFSDEAGKVEFINLPNGCYRIIAIVDRRFFEKPAYYNWNEVTIDSSNKNANIIVVNRIKQGYYRR